ncbi:MAG: hypothetical protein LBL74_04430 [Bacteroidales bacterium]|nr:hypothetical protein [Bacteroidales bacterium]
MKGCFILTKSSIVGATRTLRKILLGDMPVSLYYVRLRVDFEIFLLLLHNENQGNKRIWL